MSDALAEKVIEKIKSHAAPEVGEITVATQLTDLGIHSLELTEIIFDIEDEFGVEVDISTSDAWADLSVVGDIVEAVRAIVTRKTA